MDVRTTQRPSSLDEVATYVRQVYPRGAADRDLLVALHSSVEEFTRSHTDIACAVQGTARPTASCVEAATQQGFKDVNDSKASSFARLGTTSVSHGGGLSLLAGAFDSRVSAAVESRMEGVRVAEKSKLTTSLSMLTKRGAEAHGVEATLLFKASEECFEGQG